MSDKVNISNDLESRIEQFLSDDVAPFVKSLSDLHDRIEPDADPVPNDDFHRRVHEALLSSQLACRALEVELGDHPEAIAAARRRFQQATDAVLRHSWFVDHARGRPSGFPGDYEMLLRLYDRKTPAKGLGGYIDLCLVDIPLAQAVRTRLDGVRDFLLRELDRRTGDVRILDIACGPCREFIDWPKRSVARRVEVTAIDSDPRALEYLEQHVVDQIRPGIELAPTRYNALRTRSAAMNRKRFGTFDIIYSVGLCDYLSDEHLEGMLSAWRETLSEGGVMYVAFKDCRKYDKTPYQWHLDWFFLQRTEEDVRDLFARSGFDLDQVELVRDESGIIMNFIHRTAPTRIVRVDDRHAVERADAPGTEPAKDRPAK